MFDCLYRKICCDVVCYCGVGKTQNPFREKGTYVLLHCYCLKCSILNHVVGSQIYKWIILEGAYFLLWITVQHVVIKRKIKCSGKKNHIKDIYVPVLAFSGLKNLCFYSNWSIFFYCQNFCHFGRRNDEDGETFASGEKN